MILGIGISNVYLARNGHEAEEITKLHAPSIVLLDVNLKNGECGIELAKRSRALNNSKIIYLMSDTNKQKIRRALNTNSNSILFKPFNEEELINTIASTINQHQLKTSDSYSIDYHSQRKSVIHKENQAVHKEPFLAHR